MLPGWLEIVLRSLGLFVVLLIASKITVKKTIGNYSFFEAVSTLVIGVIIAFGSFHIGIPIGYSIIALIVWISLVAIIGYASIKSISFRTFIHGKGTPVIKDGKVLEDNLKKQRYTTDDLLKNLRSKNVFKVADVEFAILESSGDINVLLKKEYQPATPSDLNIPVAPIKEPQTVVMDGKVMDEPLSTIGLNRAWLEGELDKQGVAIENVFLGQVDSYGELTIDLFDDKIKVPEPKAKPLLLATIKKCQADLELFSFQTENKSAKHMFKSCSKEIDEVLQNVQKYLQ